MFPEQLFDRAGAEFLALLAGLPAHLDAAMPLRRQHRAALFGDIRRLSHLLTEGREELRRDYLSDPAALSAYLRYFLPWNVFRLGTLFAGLALDPGGERPQEEATVIDLGAGPLTTALALWMARPRLRRRALHLVCVDRAGKAMRTGLDVLESLAGPRGLAPWRVTLVKGQLDARLREKADLLVMANALNEVLHRGENDLLADAEALSGRLSGMLSPTGRLLVVEPGVRPSAHLMAALRQGLMEHGLTPLSPCPHQEPCPMSGRGYTAWCHFNFDAATAPAWLRRLSDQAKLPKDNVSLSFLYASARGRPPHAADGRTLVRAVSGPFALPDAGGTRRYGQYACSERGLTLLSLPRKHLVPLPGALLEATWPEAPERDAKSGALVLPLGGEAAPAQAPAKPVETSPHKPLRPQPRRKPAAQAAAPDPTAPAGKRQARPQPVEERQPGQAVASAHVRRKTPGQPPQAEADPLAKASLEELLAQARALEAALDAAGDAADDADDDSGGDAAAGRMPRRPRKPARQGPGRPANRPAGKPGAKPAPKAGSRAGRKSGKR